MRRVFIVLAVLGLVASLSASSRAEDDEGPSFLFGASTSYVYDFNDPDTGAGANALAYSTFEQDESFNIDMIQLGIAGARGKLGYAATVDFGDLAGAAGDSADGDVALQTANLSYTGEVLSVAAGRFGTPIGYEVLEPWGNAHISRSWGWQAQPINHDGVLVGGSFGPVEVSLGAVNGFTVSDFNGNDQNDDKGVLGSASVGLGETASLYVAGIYTEEPGDLETTMFNAILSGDVAPAALALALVANWRQDDPDGGPTAEFWNVGAYAGRDFGPVRLAVRGDYEEDDGVLTSMDTSIWSATLTGSVELVEGVIARLEYRHDDADEDIFEDGSSPDDSLDTLQAQLLWLPEI